MIRSGITLAGMLITGALFGSFAGKFIGMAFPHGRVHALLATDVVAGLHPTTLDLRVAELTLGCLFHFNMTSVAGVVAAALLFKLLLR